MQDDGNLVVYSASGKVARKTDTRFDSLGTNRTTFRKVRFVNVGGGVITHPLVKDVHGHGENDLWNPYDSGDHYWATSYGKLQFCHEHCLSLLI